MAKQQNWLQKFGSEIKKGIKAVIDYPFSGSINNPNYSSWNTNIRKGTPQNNLKGKK